MREATNKINMKKIIAFAEVVLYVLATIGGLGYLLHIGRTAIAMALVVLAVMAFPAFRKAIKELTSAE